MTHGVEFGLARPASNDLTAATQALIADLLRGNPDMHAGQQQPSKLSNGNAILSWVASAGDPDIGDSVDYYRIYRDGTTYADRYDRTGMSSELTWTDTNTNGVAHDYSVVAVDTQLAESAFSNTVTR